MKVLDKVINLDELSRIEEQMLLKKESKQQSLFGINIYYDNGEIEFDSLT